MNHRVEIIQLRRICWTPPSRFTKLKVDRVLSRSSNIGFFGVVCRDSEGIYLGASSINCEDVIEPATLEALMCCDALALAKDLSLSNIVVASYYKEVIKDINQATRGKYASII